MFVYNIEKNFPFITKIVPQHGICVYANIQFNLHDVAHRTLERLFAVFGANASRIPIKFVGGHKRASGELLLTKNNKKCPKDRE